MEEKGETKNEPSLIIRRKSIQSKKVRKRVKQRTDKRSIENDGKDNTVYRRVRSMIYIHMYCTTILPASS